MTREEAQSVIMTEQKCVDRVSTDRCNRDCANCDLIMDDAVINEAYNIAIKALEQPEQRWIPCGKCIHADGKHRWCKILDRTINEDYFCCWAEPFREEGEE